MDATGEVGRSDLCQRVIKPPLREAGDPIHHGNNETEMNSSILTLPNNGGLPDFPACRPARSQLPPLSLRPATPHPPPTPPPHPSPSSSNFLQKSNASATLFSISPFHGNPLLSLCRLNKWTQPQPSRHQSFHSSFLFFFSPSMLRASHVRTHLHGAASFITLNEEAEGRGRKQMCVNKCIFIAVDMYIYIFFLPN